MLQTTGFNKQENQSRLAKTVEAAFKRLPGNHTTRAGLPRKGADLPRMRWRRDSIHRQRYLVLLWDRPEDLGGVFTLTAVFKRLWRRKTAGTELRFYVYGDDRGEGDSISRDGLLWAAVMNTDNSCSVQQIASLKVLLTNSDTD